MASREELTVLRKRLSHEVLKLGFPIRTVCEVGPYYPQEAQIAGLVDYATRAIFIEPNSKACKALKKAFPHADVVEGAVVDDDHEDFWTNFIDLGDSEVSFVEGTISPILKHPTWHKVSRQAKAISVPAVPFRTVDDGTIDVISIDCEGSEWHVIGNMASRPKVLSVEIGAAHNEEYTNEHHDRIMGWLTTEGYALWYRCDSDQVYIRA